MLLTSQTETFRDTLEESFAEGIDGYWYPMEPGTPLVRVQFAPSGYSVERRRNDRNPWMPIRTATYDEFEPNAWRTWRERWAMVEA